jgi:putative endonuclease
MTTTRARGDEAEAIAARVLERAGLVIEARNYRAGPVELDLVARDGETLCFVEVRARRSARFGSAAASVGRTKRTRLERAAAAYLASRPGPAPRCRFDVITLDGPPERARLRWHKGAFRAEDA